VGGGGGDRHLNSINAASLNVHQAKVYIKLSEDSVISSVRATR